MTEPGTRPNPPPRGGFGPEVQRFALRTAAPERGVRGGVPPVLVALAALCALPAAGCLSFHAGLLPDAPKDATYATVDAVVVHYVEDRPPGEADPPVAVLVHGFGATTAEWELVRPRLLEAGYRVIAPDLKGHGYTSRPPGDYSIEAHARLVLGLLDKLGVREFSVVGHSFGSAVALSVALAARDRVKRIALYNGMFFDEQQPTVFHWARLGGLGEVVIGAFYTERLDEKLENSLYDPSAVTEEWVERLEEVWSAPGARAAALATIRAIDYEELEKQYGTVEQPVLLIWGRDDKVTPLEYGERMQKRLRRAELFVVPQCGHAPMVEAHRPTGERLVRFLRGDGT